MFGSMFLALAFDFYLLTFDFFHGLMLPPRRPVGRPLHGRIVVWIRSHTICCGSRICLPVLQFCVQDSSFCVLDSGLTGSATAALRSAVLHFAICILQFALPPRIARQASPNTDPDATSTAVSAAVRATSTRTHCRGTRTADRQTASPALRHTSPRTPGQTAPETRDEGLSGTTFATI